MLERLLDEQPHQFASLLIIINGCNSSPEECTMHDIDVMQRIVEYFLMHEQQQQQKTGKSNVSKLLDNYLAEVARDPNLSVTKFQVLAELLPESARICDDGLYRAIDIYLKVLLTSTFSFLLNSLPYGGGVYKSNF